MTLSDPNLRFKGHPTVWRRISRKQYMLELATWRHTGFSVIAELRTVSIWHCLSYLCSR